MLAGFLLDVGGSGKGSADLQDMSFWLSMDLQLVDTLLLPALLVLGLIQPQSLALIVVLHLAVGIPFAHLVDVVRVDDHLPALLGNLSCLTAIQTLVEVFQVHRLPLLVLRTALPSSPTLLIPHHLYQQLVTVLDLAPLRALPLTLETKTALEGFCGGLDVEMKTGWEEGYLGGCSGEGSYLWRPCTWLFFNIKAYKF